MRTLLVKLSKKNMIFKMCKSNPVKGGWLLKNRGKVKFSMWFKVYVNKDLHLNLGVPPPCVCVPWCRFPAFVTWSFLLLLLLFCNFHLFIYLFMILKFHKVQIQVTKLNKSIDKTLGRCPRQLKILKFSHRT